MAQSKGSQPNRDKREQPNRDRRDRPNAAARRAKQRRQWMIGGVVVVIIAVVIGYFAYRAVADLPGVSMPDQGNAHIQSASEPHVTYNTDPPTSGPHLPHIAPWGIHNEPIVKEL